MEVEFSPIYEGQPTFSEVDVVYESGFVEEIKRDAELADRLGFLDLNLRLETAINKGM